MKYTLPFIVCLMVFSACASTAPPPTATPQPPTPTVVLEEEPSPTFTPRLPTATPESVQKVATIAPPEPTATPTETLTPIPPTPTETPNLDWRSHFSRDDKGLAMLGNPSAPVTMYDFSDFMWPSCRTYVLGTEPELVETYIKEGQLKLIFAPVLNHKDRSYQSHQAAECASEQGKFWEFHNTLFENQDKLWAGDIQTTLKALAAQNGLDTELFNACLDEQRYLDRVLEQDEFRKSRGILGQPVFDIEGVLLFGPQPFAVFQQTIERSLNP